MSSIRLNINLDSADEGQNLDTVMFLVNALEMIMVGFKKKKTNIIFIFHRRIYLVAFLMSLSILPCSTNLDFEGNLTLYLICQFWALPIQQLKDMMSKILINGDTII